MTTASTTKTVFQTRAGWTFTLVERLHAGALYRSSDDNGLRYFSDAQRDNLIRQGAWR